MYIPQSCAAKMTFVQKHCCHKHTVWVLISRKTVLFYSLRWVLGFTWCVISHGGYSVLRCTQVIPAGITGAADDLWTLRRMDAIGRHVRYWDHSLVYLWLMPMTLAPETDVRKLASVSGTSVIQSGAEFFWRQILESDRTCSILRQNLATTWSKYWFVIGQWSMLLLFSFVGVVNFVCILDYWNYLTYSVYLTWAGWIAR